MPAMPDPSGPHGEDRAAPGEPRVGILDAYREAWEHLWAHFWILLGLTLLAFLINSPPSIASALLGPETQPGAPVDPREIFPLMGATWAYSILVGIPLGYGLFYVYLQAVREEGPELADLFEGFRRYGAALSAGILQLVITVVGFLLLIVPGIVAAIRLSFVPFLVTDEGLGGLDAIKESWRRTQGHGWRLLGLVLLAIPIVLFGLVLLIVGAIPAVMWVYATMGVFYLAVTHEPDAPVPDDEEEGDEDASPAPTSFEVDRGQRSGTTPAAGATVPEDRDDDASQPNEEP